MQANSERAQAFPLLLVFVAAVASVLVIIATVGRRLIDRAGAEAAADAVASAAVHGGRAEADAIARANHAVIVHYRESGRRVDVEVRVGRATASARAAPGVVATSVPAQSSPTSQGYARNRAGPGS